VIRASGKSKKGDCQQLLSEALSNFTHLVNGFIREFSAGGFGRLSVSAEGKILGSDKQEVSKWKRRRNRGGIC
jgi:hypothetical protein